MAIITLPSSGFVEALPRFQDFSTRHIPNFGGEEQVIIRPGGRFAVQISLPRRAYAALGERGAMLWISKLNQAKQGEALFPFPQPGFNPGAAGTPLVNGAGQSGSTLNMDGFAANYAYREGQFFSIIHSGNRYLYQFTASGSANGSGVIAAAPIFPMLRVSPADNAVIEVERPMIQGRIEGESSEWNLDFLKTCGITFAIMEMR